MLKKILLLLIAASMLTACASTNPTVNLAPAIALPTHNGKPGVAIGITSADRRDSPALASVNRNGQLISLNASRDPRFLLQEALEKQMIARGYRIEPDGAVNIQIIIDKLYADISQGDLRYRITTSANISVVTTARNGKIFTQNYHARYTADGAFQATNKNIANTLNITLSNIITDMANDGSVNNFISNNS